MCVMDGPERRGIEQRQSTGLLEFDGADSAVQVLETNIGLTLLMQQARGRRVVAIDGGLYRLSNLAFEGQDGIAGRRWWRR